MTGRVDHKDTGIVRQRTRGDMVIIEKQKKLRVRRRIPPWVGNE